MKKIVVISLTMLFLALSVFCIVFSFDQETKEMQDQESFSELVAEQYLINISKQYVDNKSPEANESKNPTESSESDLDYVDNEIYAYFDESDAHGFVDCVLEIPAIGLRQSIFSGTVEQIKHDLSRWLAVTARSDYILGATQYCIYMHNPRDKSIKISLAQDGLVAGDYMVVTQKDTVYLYTVVGVFSEWRNKCTEKYVNANGVSCEKLYIFTCARGEWQGKNLVIEGTVYDSYSLSDWAENKNEYIDKYKKEVGLIVDETTEETQKQHINLTLSKKNERLYATIANENFTAISCSIGVFDEDGYLVKNIDNPILVSGSNVKIPELPSGQYYIGIYECDESYYSDTSYSVTIDKTTSTYKFATSDEEEEQTQTLLKIIKISAIALILISLILGVVGVISNIKKK